MASIELGTRVELYNGSGTWGHSDGVVVETRDDGNIVCDFTERNSGDTYQLTFGAEQWRLLVLDGYLEVKDES